jgi:hypothetical protein
MSLTDNCIFDLDENVTRTPVSYKNRFGIRIAADLYRPKDFDESQEYAAIIVGAPYGGVKEQGPGIYAQNMALRGFVALTFDPSFNGYSGVSRATRRPPTSSSRTSAPPSTTWARDPSSTGSASA